MESSLFVSVQVELGVRASRENFGCWEESIGKMAGNEWINGYLEAILDTGERIHDQRGHDFNKEGFKAAKYFVETVTGFDENSLYRTWIKVLR